MSTPAKIRHRVADEPQGLSFFQVHRRVVKMVNDAGGAAAFADLHDCSAYYIASILREKEPIPAWMLAKAGIVRKRIIIYRYLDAGT